MQIQINQLDDETRGEIENETEISGKEKRLLNHMEKLCSMKDHKRQGGNSHKEIQKDRTTHCLLTFQLQVNERLFNFQLICVPVNICSIFWVYYHVI